MRLFIGIPLAEETSAELSVLVSRLRLRAASLRWSPPESWHITLQFLGNATQAQMDCLTTHLGQVRSAPVSLKLAELGSFERAGVLFADVVVSPALAALQERVVDVTRRCGFLAEVRPFHPHITLARKSGSEGAGLQRTPLGPLARWAKPTRLTPFAAHEFLLYESHTDPEGARYQVRGRFSLNSRLG